MGIVYLEHDESSFYPEVGFDPDEAYPEYPFPHSVSQGKNDAYRMVRNCLVGLGLDRERFGTSEWNPLGKLLEPGQTVVVKPNWVLHQNNNADSPEFAMECLVTHGSVIRAICDYCLIALKGQGKVVVGDAPVQDCDIDLLFEKMRYRDILDFYRAEGIGLVEFKDFRAYRSYMNDMKVITGKSAISDGVDIDLGDRSIQTELFPGQYFQVANYDKSETSSFHSGGRHVYSVSRDALQADLIINVPKPKCHRFAGMTGAMKNLVGVACRKETLPHRKSGSAEEGGDSYRSKSALKKIAEKGLSKKVEHESQGKTARATFTWLWAGFFCLLSKKFAKDPYLIGSWYGNDTIWRTVVDLNYIVEHADKEGILHEESQRKSLCVADMLVAGEKAGPLSPSPKKMGLMVGGESFAEVDAVLCRVMGFPLDEIPAMRAVCSNKTNLRYEEPRIVSNKTESNGDLSSVRFSGEWAFEPHPDWKARLLGGDLGSNE